MRMGPIIGHRGAAGLAPENTIASFALAHQLGCRSVEFDVVLSGDGQAFLLHDHSLQRTTNGCGMVGAATADYLRSLDAGSWFSPQFKGVPIPSLREALLWLNAHQMLANIELKPYPGSTAATVRVVLSEIRAVSPTLVPLVSSFEREALYLCRTEDTSLPLGWLLDSWDESAIHEAKSLGCVSMHLNHRIATKARVRSLQQQGFLVYVYTVNQQRLIAKYQALGVDGVFSDYPQWVWDQQGRSLL